MQAELEQSLPVSFAKLKWLWVRNISMRELVGAMVWSCLKYIDEWFVFVFLSKSPLPDPGFSTLLMLTLNVYFNILLGLQCKQMFVCNNGDFYRYGLQARTPSIGHQRLWTGISTCSFIKGLTSLKKHRSFNYWLMGQANTLKGHLTMSNLCYNPGAWKLSNYACSSFVGLLLTKD